MDQQVGYGILITLSRETEPMSYGRGREPSPLTLLRRGRMHLFETVQDAKTALSETLIAAMAEKATWAKPGKAKFTFVEVVTNRAAIVNCGDVREN